MARSSVRTSVETHFCLSKIDFGRPAGPVPHTCRTPAAHLPHTCRTLLVPTCSKIKKNHMWKNNDFCIKIAKTRGNIWFFKRNVEKPKENAGLAIFAKPRYICSNSPTTK